MLPVDELDGHSSSSGHSDGSPNTRCWLSPSPVAPTGRRSSILSWRKASGCGIISGMGSLGAPVRQDAALSAIARYLATTGEVLGALVVGSMAAGTANAASDVDLIVCAHPGRFEEAWQIRKHMHVTGALASWDDKGDGGAEIGVHRWVTSDVILIEALFATPGSGVRLGRPWMVIAGKPRVAACFPPRPPRHADRSI